MSTISLEDIWTRFKIGGDPRARETLIDNYGYLVKITAGRIAGGVPPSLDREDLISAGLIGLIKAVDQYDCGRQVKFETYAIALIRGAILELLRGEDWAPRSVRDRIKQLERTYAAVEQRLGRPGTWRRTGNCLSVSRVFPLKEIPTDVDSIPARRLVGRAASHDRAAGGPPHTLARRLRPANGSEGQWRGRQPG